MRVLIIEDNRDHLYLIEHILSSDDEVDFIVDTVLCGKDAIEKIAESPNLYDSILIDYTLPDITGLDLIDKINDLTGNIPIIMITGRNEKKTINEAIRRGAHTYLIKSDCFLEKIPYTVKKAVKAKTSTASDKQNTTKDNSRTPQNNLP